MELLARIKNRIIYHTILSKQESKNGLTHNITPQNTLLIFANPRGGSTWLAEILNEIPDTALALEPLYKDKLIEFEKQDNIIPKLSNDKLELIVFLEIIATKKI